MENNSGKYLYCLIEASRDIQYSSRGVDGSFPVYTIRHRDIAAVTSDIKKDVIKVTAEECLVHEKVLEEVMLSGALLPFEFGTISPGRESVEGLLKDNYSKIKKSVHFLRDKVEINVKAVWSDMNKIFQEIVSKNRHIALYKEEIRKKSPAETYEDRIKIGQLVAEELYVKKEKEMYSIVTVLKQSSARYVPEKIIGDNMIFNGAFLVRKENLKRFETALTRIGQRLNGRIGFRYAGPLPPYNFTDLKLFLRG